MRENASIVASLLTRSRYPSPLLRYASVYSCCLAKNVAKRCSAMRDESSRLNSARRKHRFVNCSVIAGACFDVTVLAWRKYTTLYYLIIRIYTRDYRLQSYEILFCVFNPHLTFSELNYLNVLSKYLNFTSSNNLLAAFI
jgi:hypothetical protein